MHRRIFVAAEISSRAAGAPLGWTSGPPRSGTAARVPASSARRAAGTPSFRDNDLSPHRATCGRNPQARSGPGRTTVTWPPSGLGRRANTVSKWNWPRVRATYQPEGWIIWEVSGCDMKRERRIKISKFSILFFLFMTLAVVASVFIVYFWTTIRTGSTEQVFIILLAFFFTTLLCIAVYNYIDDRYD